MNGRKKFIKKRINNNSNEETHAHKETASNQKGILQGRQSGEDLKNEQETTTTMQSTTIENENVQPSFNRKKLLPVPSRESKQVVKEQQETTQEQAEEPKEAKQEESLATNEPTNRANEVAELEEQASPTLEAKPVHQQEEVVAPALETEVTSPESSDHLTDKAIKVNNSLLDGLVPVPAVASKGRVTNAALAVINQGNNKRMKVGLNVLDELNVKVDGTESVEIYVISDAVVMKKAVEQTGHMIKSNRIIYNKMLVDLITNTLALDFTNCSTRNLVNTETVMVRGEKVVKIF